MELSDVQTISLLNIKEAQNYVVNENKTATLFLGDLNDDVELYFDLKEESCLKLSIIADNEIKSCKIFADLGKYAQFEVFFADFSVKSLNLNVEIKLNQIGANANWHLASLADKADQKNISINMLHNAPETNGQVDNYGVCKNNAKLLFAGTSHVLNGSVKSKTQQNAKIMVFDEHSDAIAKPILRIDENDIEANHAAIVGKISDEHLFYLTSRGISLEDARTLITLGYLKPIFKGFSEDKAEYLNNLIGGRL